MVESSNNPARSNKKLLKISIIAAFAAAIVLYLLMLAIFDGDPARVVDAQTSMASALQVWRIFLYTGLTWLYIHTRRLNHSKGNTDAVLYLDSTRNAAIALVLIIELPNLIKLIGF